MKDDISADDRPSVYDYFYYDYCIVNCLCELESIKNFFKRYNSNFNHVYYGYLYFLEFSIINIINHLEAIIGDIDVYELIRWGNVTKENEEFTKIIKSHPEGKYILLLDSIRRKFSKWRFKKEYNEKEIIEKLYDLKDKLNELNFLLIKNYEISKLETSRGKEELLVLNGVNKYNWVEISLNDFISNRYDPIPEWPDHPFFYLMSSNMMQSYYLQNPLIKSDEINYLKGFSLTLLYLYNNLIPNQINLFEQDLLTVRDWLELHKIGGKIHEEFIGNNEILTKLFNVNYQPEKTFFKKDIINNYEELRLALRGRKIRVVSNRFSGDYPNRENLFNHFLFGATRMYEFNLRDKPEIIEFKHIYEKGNQIEYSYAISIPFGANWLFFDKLCIENDWEPSSFTKMRIEAYIKTFKERDIVSFSRYIIKGNLLKKYIDENDFETKVKNDKKYRFDECIGLLGEFLAGFYLLKVLKEQNITNLIKLDFHRDIESTDIDVIGETEDCIIVFQVKASMSFDFNVHKKILDNFSKISDNIKLGNKTIRRFLFILSNNISEREYLKLLEDEKILKSGGISNHDIENKKREIFDFFEKNNVKTRFLEDLIELLKNDGAYNGFLDKLNIILPKNEWEEDEE